MLGKILSIPNSLRYLKLWAEGIFDANFVLNATFRNNTVAFGGNRFINPSKSFTGCKVNCAAPRTADPGTADKV